MQMLVASRDGLGVDAGPPTHPFRLTLACAETCPQILTNSASYKWPLGVLNSILNWATEDLHKRLLTARSPVQTESLGCRVHRAPHIEN